MIIQACSPELEGVFPGYYPPYSGIAMLAERQAQREREEQRVAAVEMAKVWVSEQVERAVKKGLEITFPNLSEGRIDLATREVIDQLTRQPRYVVGGHFIAGMDIMASVRDREDNRIVAYCLTLKVANVIAELLNREDTQC